MQRSPESSFPGISRAARLQEGSCDFERTGGVAANTDPTATMRRGRVRERAVITDSSLGHESEESLKPAGTVLSDLAVDRLMVLGFTMAG